MYVDRIFLPGCLLLSVFLKGGVKRLLICQNHETNLGCGIRHTKQFIRALNSHELKPLVANLLTPKNVGSCSEPSTFFDFCTCIMYLEEEHCGESKIVRSSMEYIYLNPRTKCTYSKNILRLKILSTFCLWIDENVLHPRTHFSGCR